MSLLADTLEARSVRFRCRLFQLKKVKFGDADHSVVKARGSSLHYQELGVLPDISRERGSGQFLQAVGPRRTENVLVVVSTGDRGVEEAVDFARLIGF